MSENLTKAEITFNKFYVMKLIGDAVDKVRRDETKSQPELKASRYLWLKNDAKLKTGRAWAMWLTFQDIYKEPNRRWAEI